MNPLDLDIAGERVRLDARRALAWPRRHTVFVADVHLGKASLLRQAGAALPRGTTSADLDRLSDVLAAHAATRLVVLGDLVHGRERADAEWLDTFARWRQRHSGLEFVLVAGNHDRHMSMASLGVEVVPELADPPFVGLHAPDVREGAHTLAGHIHPAARVRDGRLRTRWPAFWIDAATTILPAFGSLCGMAPFDRPTGASAYAATPGGIIRITARE
jgi:DNA ligase-associated metallophosphoesterase